MTYMIGCPYCPGNHETKQDFDECRKDYRENSPEWNDLYSAAEVRDLHEPIKQVPFRERGPDTEE